ncbi:LOW QUALITY PROTEIN: podocalyxin [Lynx canadensis]|uniref:LOW QUALITY PROTEIN: podocalyxin n=1 Tax=Lynx canadensis TaxID=61383 RepID=UPI0011B0006B|nr:LOW QUALITY PROTEIN: podocalyxin [Lynx canadensis]
MAGWQQGLWIPGKKVPTATGSKTAVEHIKTAVEHINSGNPDAALTHGGESPVENTKTTTATTATTATVPPTPEERKLSSATSAVVPKSPSTAPSNLPAAPSLAPTQKEGVTLPVTRGVLTGPPTAPDPPTTKSVKPDTTQGQPAGSGAQSSASVPTDRTTTQGTGPLPPLVSPTRTTPAPSTATSASPHQPAATATLKPPGTLQAPDKVSTASSTLGTETSPDSTLHGAPSTPTSFVASQGNHEHSSKVPTVPGTSSSATGTSSSATGTPSSATGTPSSATGTSSSTTGTSSSVTGTSSSVPGISSSVPGTSSSSSGPVATFTVMGPGSFSTHLAPNTPQVSSTSSPALTHRDDGVLPAAVGQIQCGHPENQTERMLILNFTKTSPCETNFSDDKLVTLLCRAAKATFNPPQDRCHIRLTPIPETQAVAIKEIAIQTNLLPRDVYELLKDKWDELQEVGVSNMKLGDQGPPEETEDRFSMPLIITIVCMASFLLLVAALYGCCHQRLSQRKDQQRLTEELQTVENGYHDNPTLEVMETSSEMQEKKVVNLNGELGDSWIVPLDNLTKDDLDEEEDTHL